MQGRRVQIDAVAAAAYHLAEEEIGHEAGQRTAVGTRKAAVEIAPVWHVARVVEKAEAVDDGHRQQACPASVLQRRMDQDAPDDLDALDLVAMHGA